LIVVFNARAGKLSVVGLAIEVMVTKFVLLLLFWEKGNRNGFVKIITAPLIFNLFGVQANSRNLYLRLLTSKTALNLLLILIIS